MEFNEFSTQTAGGGETDLFCWLCQKGTAARAIFCCHCGTIQPVRNIDHFARMGLERRVDVDLDLLDRQYAALKRTLDPARFSMRGMGERGHASKQIAALDDAYDTLRDVLKRGRYWMELHSQENALSSAPSCPIVAELRREAEQVADPSHCDRLANRAGQAMEGGIIDLLQSLRNQDWNQAGAALARIDGLEGVLSDLRSRRASLAAKAVPHGIGEISSVK